MARRGLSPAALAVVRDVVLPEGRVVRVRPLRGGISSSVHVVHLRSERGGVAAVVVRRYGAYAQEHDPHAAAREFQLLMHLAAIGQPVARPLLLETVDSVFEAPTVVLTRLPGRPLLAPRDLGDYLRQMAEALLALHRVPVDGLQFLPRQAVSVSRALRDELEPKDDPLHEAVWDAARAGWARVAASGERQALVHGDYWPGNMLWLRGRLVGIIDWEQPRLGDPTKDVATCQGDLTILFGLSAADEFLRCYEEAGGTVTNLGFWRSLISTWAVREITGWATAYPLLGRPDITAVLAEQRIREYARSALDLA